MFVLFQVYVWRTQYCVHQEAADDKQQFDLRHRRGVHPPAALPTEPAPSGLNIRQQCLFDKIHEFCGHQLSRAEPTHSKPHQSTAATVCPSLEVAAAIGTSQKMTKEAVIMSCCVRNRQNTWLVSVNILLLTFDLVHTFRKVYLWNCMSCKGELSTHCTYWGGLQKFTFLWSVFMLQMY